MTRQRLIDALQVIDDYEMQYYMSLPPVKFSRRFERRMAAVLRRARKLDAAFARASFRRRFAAALIAVILALLMAFNAFALRDRLVKLVIEVYERFTNLFFTVEAPLHPLTRGLDVFTAHQPAFIPDGYVLTTEMLAGTVFQEYIADDGFIIFTQHKIGAASLDMNSEGVTVHDAMINGLPAKYADNQGIINILWYDDFYVFSLLTSLDVETAFEIAGSVG